MLLLMAPLTLAIGEERRSVPASASPPIAIDPAPATDPPEMASPEARETEALGVAAPGSALREGERLRLRLGKGDFLELTNRETPQDGPTRYLYQAHLPELRAYLVWVLMTEWDGYLLIDAETGDQVELWGPPLVSPDGRRFAAVSLDLAAGFVPNGIQIWRREAVGFVAEHAEEFADWGPEDAVWAGEDRLRIAQLRPLPDASGLRETSASLRRQDDGRWRLEESADAPWERVTLASGVRLRAAPDSAAPMVVRLDLGTRLAVAERAAERVRLGGLEAYWYRAANPNGANGWVFGGLTHLADPRHPEDTLSAILRRRASGPRPRDLSADLDLLVYLIQPLAELPPDEARPVLSLLAELEPDWADRCQADPVPGMTLDLPYLLQRLHRASQKMAEGVDRRLPRAALARIERLLRTCADPRGAPTGQPAPASADLAERHARVRAQIQETLALAAMVKVAVSESFMMQGRFPQDNASAGLPPPEQLIGNALTGIAVEAGAIHLTFGHWADPSLAGRILSLRPAQVDGCSSCPISWVCGDTPPVPGMTAQGANRTSAPSALLPADCRLPRD